jgi:hypothetical protein
MFLSQSELVELTGSTQPAAQERILRGWGLMVRRSNANRVMLSAEALTRWQIGERVKAASEPKLRLKRAA